MLVWWHRGEFSPNEAILDLGRFSMGLRPDSERYDDPRQVGDMCFSGYWRDAYVVLAIEKDQWGGTKSITVLNLSEPNQRWSTGTVNVKTHCTQWDWRSDQFIDHNVFALLPRWGYESYDAFIDEMRDIACHWINPKTGKQHG